MNLMNYQFTSTQLLVGGFVLVLLVMIAVAAYMEHRKTKTLALRASFGSEYDRAVEAHGSSSAAEAKLGDRSTRVEKMEIHGLGTLERERFVTEWYSVQSRFVDYPKTAVTAADDLINALLEARGYPQTGFDQRAADVSATYPRVMEDYRRAHAIAVRTGKEEATTEELRTAMIQYRKVFEGLTQAEKPTKQKSAA